MSISLDVTELATAISEHDYAHLLTVNGDGRAYAVAVIPALAGGALRIGAPGRRSLANTGSRPNISVVFPPCELGGYSLIVDGDPALDGEALAVTPTTALMHRPATAAGEQPPGSCGADCLPVDLGTG